MFTRTLRLLAVLCLFGAFHAPAAVLYVDLNSANPVSPFSSWATAATNIQDAVDAASTGDEVLVTNGIYQSGGRVLPGSLLTNRLVLTNAIIVQSVNGPLVTTVAGYQIPGDITGDSAIRCIYLANGAALTGFTITLGATPAGGNDVEAGGDTSGAGILCPLGDPSTVSNCIFVSNVAGDFGGGIYGGTLYNCLVVSNTAQLGSYGGGTFGGNYYNCTITANTAGIGAGDAFGNLVNCIVYGNFATYGGNYDFDTLNYCCTTPDPGTTGNVINDPLFINPAAGNFRLQAASPCINAGNSTFVTTATDLAGNPRISGGTVDIGAYELQFHYVDINSTNPVAPFSSWATAATNIQDAVDVAANYAEVLVTNGTYQGDVLVTPDAVTNCLIATNALTLQSVNGPDVTVIDGLSLYRCFSLASGCVLSGFTIANGNSAVDAGGVACADATVLVTNCLFTGNYAANNGGGISGGSAWNTVFINNSSGNSGGAAENCLLTQCTFTNNAAQYYGGGADASVLYDCYLVGNQTGTSYPPVTMDVSVRVHPLFVVSNFGGGANNSTASRCYFYYNTSQVGGALEGSTADNCLIVSNSADFGGGVDSSTVYNCTLTGNIAYNFGGTADSSTLYNCLAYGNGDGDTITNDPLFVDFAAGDFHLQSNSPCINAGNNAYVSSSTDLDGNPRISGGTVDIGAYEFQNPASIISYAWLDQYSFPTDGSADFTDTDGSGMNHWQDWVAGLDPTNPSSVLQMLAPTPSGTNLVVTWQSVTNITYYLQRATNLSLQPAFQPLATNLPGQAGTTSFTDTNAPAPGPYFYRVGVQSP
jgi:hypothetical protein